MNQHRYLPMTEEDKKEMLKAIGVSSVDDLFSDIPEKVRFKGEYNIKAAKPETSLMRELAKMANKNADLKRNASFLGAGVYDHYMPIIVDHVISRSEFYTAYTPYQPEISQGELQAIFEFQTMICELTGMQVANASMYDGSTAAAEAVMMAVRLTGRRSVVMARSVHPEYCEVLATYAFHQGMPLGTIPFAENGRLDTNAVEKAVTADTACLLIQSPNFFGTIEDIEALAEIAHRKGAMLVVSIAEAVSLGIVEPPRQADVIAME